MEINDLVKEMHELAVKKGWHPDDALSPAEVSEKLMLVVTELGEVMEEHRVPWHDRGEKRAYSRIYAKGDDGSVKNWEEGMKPEGFGIEVADAVIRLADLCGALGIDLEKMISIKHHYNQTRKHRHGGRAC